MTIKPSDANTAREASASQTTGFTLGQLALVLLWPLVVLGLWILFLAPDSGRVAAAVAGMQERPPVVVFNVTDRMRYHGRAGLDSNEVIKKLDEEVATLVESGYVVIDARTILGTPDAYVVGDDQ